MHRRHVAGSAKQQPASNELATINPASTHAIRLALQSVVTTNTFLHALQQIQTQTYTQEQAQTVTDTDSKTECIPAAAGGTTPEPGSGHSDRPLAFPQCRQGRALGGRAEGRRAHSPWASDKALCIAHMPLACLCRYL